MRLLTAMAVLAGFLVRAECAQYRLIFEGDSITEGTGVTSVTNVYASVLTSNYWRCSEIARVLNVAVSSSKVADCDNRYTNNVYPHRPAGGTNAILFLAVGVNNVLFQDPSANGWDLLNRYSNYCVRARADGFSVAAFTVTSNLNHGANGRMMHLSFNGLMRSNYWRFADYLVDPCSLFPTASDPTYFPDGLHWTNAVHQTVAQHIDYVIGLCGLKRSAAVGGGISTGAK